MCGIIGAYWKNPHVNAAHGIQDAMASLKHRGPDDQGYREIQLQCEPRRSLHLGHTRLSILDLSAAGRQPMTSACGRFTVVYNGEIYNYKELRLELAAKGYPFSTDTDTEVLLAAWAAWGARCLPRFVGMFAFALYDHQREALYCVRDAFGIKPFFYAYAAGLAFQFASEMGALLRLRNESAELSAQRAYDYLLYGLQDAGEHTFVEGVCRLRPAHLMCIDVKSLQITSVEAWWKPDYRLRHSLTFVDAAEQLRELFLKSVSLHLRSDVPIGAALSGGIDSSAIVCAMRKVEPELPIHTFSYLPEDPNISERPWIDIVNQHVNAVPHFVRYDEVDLLDDLADLIRVQGEPFNSTSMYAQYRIFRAAREAGIPVVLEGQGADELMGGYQGYPGQRMRSLLERGEWLPLWRFAKGWSSNPSRGGKSPWRSFLGQLLPEAWHGLSYRNGLSPGIRGLVREDWVQKHRVSIATPPMGRHRLGYGRRLAEALAHSLTDHELPSLLRFGDRNAMRFSVENRVPFLTTEMADFMLGLPESYLVSNQGESKALFRAAMRGIVPDSILDRQDKIGFFTPLTQWLNRHAQSFSDDLKGMQERYYIDPTSFIEEWDQNNGVFSEKYAYFYWRLINLSLWSAKVIK